MKGHKECCGVVTVNICCSDFEFSPNQVSKEFHDAAKSCFIYIILLTSVLFDFNSFFESVEQLSYRNREAEGTYV